MAKAYQKLSNKTFKLAAQKARDIGIVKAANEYKIPVSTLRYFINKQIVGPVQDKRGKAPILKPEEENELKQIIIDSLNNAIPMSSVQIRKKAAEIAAKHGDDDSNQQFRNSIPSSGIKLLVKVFYES